MHAQNAISTAPATTSPTPAFRNDERPDVSQERFVKTTQGPSRMRRSWAMLTRLSLLVLLALALNILEAMSLFNQQLMLPVIVVHVLVLWLLTPTQVKVSSRWRLALAALGLLKFFGVLAWAFIVVGMHDRQQHAMYLQQPGSESAN
jgi:hypothetical protein